MSHRLGNGKRAGAKAAHEALAAKGAQDVPGWRKAVGIALMLVVVANFFLAIFRVYDFTVFWIVLIAVAALMWPLGFFKSPSRP